MTPAPTNLKEIEELIVEFAERLHEMQQTGDLEIGFIARDEATTKISKMIEEAYQQGLNDMGRVDMRTSSTTPPPSIKKYKWTRTSKEETKDE